MVRRDLPRPRAARPDHPTAAITGEGRDRVVGPAVLQPVGPRAPMAAGRPAAPLAAAALRRARAPRLAVPRGVPAARAPPGAVAALAARTRSLAAAVAR